MQEIWKFILGFDDYQISSYGNVRKVSTNRAVRRFETTGGAVSVNLRKNNKSYCRSVKCLVAEAFVPRVGDEEDRDLYNSAIQLDGDRWNLRADNIMHKPRWHAIAYQKQITGWTHLYSMNESVINDVTGVIYETILDAARDTGLLPRDIANCAGGSGHTRLGGAGWYFV